MTVPAFGDNVCIADTPLTRERGFAGKRGVVFGFTTPSLIEVDVIGDAPEDVALNVYFTEQKEGFWFSPELVHLVDHASGTAVVVGSKKFVRREDGGWDEVSSTPQRPWWKFWST